MTPTDCTSKILECSLAPSRGCVLQLRGNPVHGTIPRRLAPSRGGVLLLGETWSAELTLGDPCYGPANAHPPTVEEEGAFCS